jgi:hypothetical protein
VSGTYAPLVSVRVLEPGSYAGVNKEDEAAGDWNLMRKARPVLHIDKAPGRVTHSDVVTNYKRGHGHRRQAAMSEFLHICQIIAANRATVGIITAQFFVYSTITHMAAMLVGTATAYTA